MAPSNVIFLCTKIYLTRPLKALPNGCFQNRPKDSAGGALCNNKSTGGFVDIYELKRSQRHLLAAFENNQFGASILSYLE